MKLSTLTPGDTIEVNRKGVLFSAIYKGTDENGLAKIEPLNPLHFTWRKATARQVVRRVEVQECLGVAA